MKRVLPLLLMLAVIASCGDAPKSDRAEIVDQTISQEVEEDKNAFQPDVYYLMIIGQSSMFWIGTSITGRHTGTIGFKDARIRLRGGEITEAYMTIDMTSITPEGMSESMAAKLKKDLQSKNFFDSENFPIATFTFTGITPLAGAEEEEESDDEGWDDEDLEEEVEEDADDLSVKNANYQLEGNFEMHGVTHTISFPAYLDITPDYIKLKANFNIDRTKWGMNYKASVAFGKEQIHSDINITADIHFGQTP